MLHEAYHVPDSGLSLLCELSHQNPKWPYEGPLLSHSTDEETAVEEAEKLTQQGSVVERRKVLESTNAVGPPLGEQSTRLNLLAKNSAIQ